MTDLLLKPKRTGQPGVYAPFPRKEPAWREALDRVHDAMRERNAVRFSRYGSLRLAFRPIASTAAA
jgi:aspartate kinase